MQSSAEQLYAKRVIEQVVTMLLKRGHQVDVMPFVQFWHDQSFRAEPATGHNVSPLGVRCRQQPTK